ncbi:MAG: PD-(D/E)XK nuclease family protein [Pseudomonadota bacterium]
MQYSEALTLSGSFKTAKLGDALHQLIGFTVLNADENAELVARRLLAPFTSDEAQMQKLVSQAQQFVACVKERFKPKNVWVEMPVTAKNETNQTIKGSIDLLLETEAGLVVIDHKLKGVKTPDKQQELARLYGGQLKTYKNALERNGYSVQALALNAFNSGTLMTVRAYSPCGS